MKKFHVLFTTWEYPEPGRKGNPFIASRARALAKYGVKVGLLHIHFSNPLNAISNFLKSRKLVREEKRYGIEVIYIPCVNCFPSGILSLTAFQKQLIFFTTRLRMAIYIMINGKPDVIHHHYIANGTPFITEFISRTFKIPYVVSEHSSGVVSKKYLEDKANRFYSAQDLITFVRNARVCTAIVKRYANIFTSLFAKEFIAIPNPIPDYFLERKLPVFPKLVDKGFYYFAVGNLTANKCHLRLIRAFAKELAGQNGVFLRIAGDGPMRRKLEEEIVTLNLSHKVTLLGYIPREEVLEYMDKSHVLVVSSDNEIVSSTMVEGWFRGLPTVSTDCGAHSDVIEAGNGVVCEKSDEGLSEKLRYMYENYHRYDSEMIINIAKQKYSEREIVNKFIEMYESAVV